jgi:hypothetical protein
MDIVGISATNAAVVEQEDAEAIRDKIGLMTLRALREVEGSLIRCKDLDTSLSSINIRIISFFFPIY